MNHADHVRLIRGGVVGGRWADLGSGEGAFTLALADLLGPGAAIVSVDRDPRVLKRQQAAMAARFPAARVDYVAADFRERLQLESLTGVVMANSLHFVAAKEPVLELVAGYLRPRGRLVLVEYNADRGNPWVPHPISFVTWQELAPRVGFNPPVRLESQPSRFLGEIYSSLTSTG